MANLLYPRLCFGCGRVGYYLCPRCRVEKLDIVYQQVCHVCRQTIYKGLVHQDCRKYTYLDGVLAVAKYDGLIKDLIKKAKYGFTWDVLVELGGLMAVKLQEQSNLFDNAMLTYVPTSNKRYKWRGYNQAKILAEVLANFTGWPLHGLLVKQRHTFSQAGLSREERMHNLSGAFKLNDGGVSVLSSSKQIIIVDDVFSTGATLAAAAKAIGKRYPQNCVYSYVLAANH